MSIALAPPVAGRSDPHQPRIEPVVDIALEDAVFDQHVFLGGRPLVVDRERAAATLERAIIDHSNAGCADACSDPARKGAGTLAVEIAFKSVADRLVQQHSGPAGAEQHSHLAGRRGDTLKVGERLGQRLVNRAVPAGRLKQPVIQPASAHPEAAGFAAAVTFGHDPDIEPDQRADIMRDKAIGADNLDHRPAGRQAGADLRYAGIARPGGGVDRLEQFDLVSKWHGIER